MGGKSKTAERVCSAAGGHLYMVSYSAFACIWRL